MGGVQRRPERASLYKKEQRWKQRRYGKGLEFISLKTRMIKARYAAKEQYRVLIFWPLNTVKNANV
jgi:hypothetical protein